MKDLAEPAYPAATPPLVDAHTHIREGEEAAFLAMHHTQPVFSLVHAGDSTEWHRLQPVISNHSHAGRLTLSYGVHPWQATRSLTSEDWRLLVATGVTGEIGLDTLWCHVPLPVQRQIFVEQLQLAMQLGKPVILHTKDCEEEIASILASYLPNPKSAVMIHWFSGSITALDEFINLGCYFTLAPDIATNTAQQQVALRVSAGRLLTESDGTAAVTWATGKECTPGNIPAVLEGILHTAATIRDETAETLRRQVYQNYLRYIQ